MEILSNKIVKINKPHICFASGRKFEKGVLMHRQVNVHDGINQVYSCETCNKLMESFPKLFKDNMTDVFEYECVLQYLEKDQTPEMLLIELNNKL